MARPPDLAHQRVRAVAGGVDIWWRHTRRSAPGRGRALLRDALARSHGRDPASITLVHDALGRPVLLPGQMLAERRLSAAHSGTVTVAAITLPTLATRLKIGIDIETLPALPDSSLLRCALTARERVEVADQPRHEQRDAFLRLWTAKEAVAKAIGWPLLRALVDVEITLRPALTLRRLAKDPHPQGWQLLALDLPGVPLPVTLAVHTPTAHTPTAIEQGKHPWISPEKPPSSPVQPEASDLPSPTPCTRTARNW